MDNKEKLISKIEDLEKELKETKERLRDFNRLDDGVYTCICKCEGSARLLVVNNNSLQVFNNRGYRKNYGSLKDINFKLYDNIKKLDLDALIQYQKCK